VRKHSIAATLFACSAIIAIGYNIGGQPLKSTVTATNQRVNVPNIVNAPPASPRPTVSTPSTSTSPKAPKPASSTPSVPAPTVTTLTGDSVQTPYGNVQVSITFSGGKITDVQALQLTNQGDRSTQISNYAAPILRSEVLSAQSANVASVSGATYTTQGYLGSVQSAIDKHKP